MPGGTASGLVARLVPRSLLRRVLDHIDQGLVCGSLEAHLPGGTVQMLGGRAPGPAVVVHLHRWTALTRLMLGGSAGWYQAWAGGEWSSPDPVLLFDLFMRNAATLGQTARAKGPWQWLGRAAHWLHRNSRAGARRNIHAHYDLGNDFYAAWLDPSMTYSSALWADDEQSLADAQLNKVDRLLDRLDLRSGSRLLEIGCGWGALAARAVERHDAIVHAITISPAQAEVAAARLSHASPDGLSRVTLTDYRDVTEQYDAIASVEMVEAVGQAFWPAYLDTIARALRPGGRAAIQFISIDEPLWPAYASGRDFIQTYVFPGGCLLNVGKFKQLARERGLAWHDERHFPDDYASTLKLWRLAFDRAVEAGRLPASFDQRFIDLWRYYLMYCEGGFRGRGISVGQVTLIKPLKM